MVVGALAQTAVNIDEYCRYKAFFCTPQGCPRAWLTALLRETPQVKRKIWIFQKNPINFNLSY